MSCGNVPRTAAISLNPTGPIWLTRWINLATVHVQYNAKGCELRKFQKSMRRQSSHKRNARKPTIVVLTIEHSYITPETEMTQTYKGKDSKRLY